MKATYRAFNDRLTFEVEGSNIKEVWQQVGPIAEALDSDSTCGACDSENIRLRFRKPKGFPYYELVCSNCGCCLNMGQVTAEPILFPKRKDENGNALPNHGWVKFQRNEEEPEGDRRPKQQAAQPVSRPRSSVPDDPELVKLSQNILDLKPEDVYPFLGAICDRIGANHGQSIADQAWGKAIEQHGDPQRVTGARIPVLRYLWNQIGRAS